MWIPAETDALNTASQIRFFSLVPEMTDLDENHSLNLRVETFPGLFLQSPTMPPSKGRRKQYSEIFQM
jgi:hypothetical protein